VNPLWPTLRRIVADLEAADVRFALVGGLAAGARTEPRFTRDVDLAVAVETDADAESVVRQLLDLGYRATSIVEQEAVGRLSTVRLMPPGKTASGSVVDLLFASCGIEPEIVAQAEPLALTTDLALPVAREGHLIAMKVLSDAPQRPQDRIDLVSLVQGASEDEIARAQAAVALIERRGFSRERDLRARLADLLRELA